MSEQDIRWEQRFANFNRAMEKLQAAVDRVSANTEIVAIADRLSELEKEGTIQRFEYTHELAWKVMQDYLKYQGNTHIGGSRDATRGAFNIQLIKEGATWMEMIKSRNQTSHTYNETTADVIFVKIIEVYYPCFVAFQQKMETLRRGEQGDFFSKDL